MPSRTYSPQEPQFSTPTQELSGTLEFKVPYKGNILTFRVTPPNERSSRFTGEITPCLDARPFGIRATGESVIFWTTDNEKYWLWVGKKTGSWFFKTYKDGRTRVLRSR